MSNTFKHTIYLTFIFSIMLLIFQVINAQEKPPVPVSINSLNSLNFGKIVIGNGTVTIPNTGGTATSSGGVFILPSANHPASFQVECNPGFMLRININNGNNVTLTGSNGGTLSCNLSDARINGTDVPHNNVFVTQVSGQTTDIIIGGTLTLEASQPTGNYSGNFTVTIIME